MQCAYFTVAMGGGYQRVTGEALVNHQNVHLWPELALGHCLHRGDLKQIIRTASPVLCLDDAMLGQPILVGHRRGLVNQGGAVTQEHGPLAALDGLVAHSKTQVGLACPGGGHDQLVLVAITNPLAQGFMGIDLKLAGCWESVITPAWRWDFAHFLAFSLSSCFWRSLTILMAALFSFINSLMRRSFITTK